MLQKDQLFNTSIMSINNYFLRFYCLLCVHIFTVQATGTINAAPGNAAADAKAVHDCLKSVCNACWLDVIAHRKIEDRRAIAAAYQQQFNVKDADLKNLISSGYTDLNAAAYAKSLISTRDEIFYEILNNAKNNQGILEVLFSATKEDKANILVHCNGEPPTLNDESDDVDNVVNELWTRNRALSPNKDANFVSDRVQEICEKAEDWGDDRTALDYVMMEVERGQSKKILEAVNCDGKNFLAMLDDNMEDDKKPIYKTLASYIMDYATYYAELLNHALNVEHFTENWIIVEVIVLHYQVDLVEIKNRYKELYKKTVKEEIKEVSPDGLYTITSYLLGERLESDKC